jgi:tetratricopeptide (TPR) repeat protein
MQAPEDVHKPVTEEPGESPPRPQSRIATWLVVLAAATLVIGPLLGTGLHQERARWRMAAGLEHWLDNDLPAALAELDVAAGIAPDYTPVFSLRSQWRIAVGDYAGALADAEQVLKAAPQNVRGIQLRADALMHLGRSREAAKVWAEAAAVPQAQYENVDPSLLNSVAYFRALGKYDLDTAWLEINAALEQLGEFSELARQDENWRSAQVAFLDTRGYIRFLRGDHEGALEDLHPAVLGAERQRREQHLKKRTEVRLGVRDPRAVARELRDVDRSLAVIRYHRALVLEALDRSEEAEKDYRRVRELGFEPNEKLF